LTVANRKKLEAAHHRWQRRILHISWKDKITNKTIRERTGPDKLEEHHQKETTELDGTRGPNEW